VLELDAVELVPWLGSCEEPSKIVTCDESEVLMTTRLIAAALATAVLGGSTASADAATLSKRDARAFLVRAFPRAAPRALLRDERAAFFSTERLWVQDARHCGRRDAATVTCRFRARLVPDAAHRKRNWWPISCRGKAQARRLGDGRLQGSPRDYVCRTVRS